MTAFYRIVPDDDAFPRWFLGTPVDATGANVSIWAFNTGQQAEVAGPLSIPLRAHGPQLDINFGSYEYVVAPAALNEELEQRFGIAAQRIPVTVEGAYQPLEILNALARVRCVDEARSEYTKWSEEDGRPDKVGHYRMFMRLRIDPEAARGRHLFRIDEWPVALLASQELKDFIEERCASGVFFVPVTDAALAAVRPSARVLPFARPRRGAR